MLQSVISLYIFCCIGFWLLALLAYLLRFYFLHFYQLFLFLFVNHFYIFFCIVFWLLSLLAYLLWFFLLQLQQHFLLPLVNHCYMYIYWRGYLVWIKKVTIIRSSFKQNLPKSLMLNQ